ncbi:mechanosensitive ion channel [Alicyclobacillus sp. SO9]|nr:mechanosensitive ion channel [Alicyclobacillus sp. SO9]
MFQQNWVRIGEFLLLCLIILSTRVVLRVLLNRLETHHGAKRWIHVLKSLVNWGTFYALLVLILAYFSSSKWMFSRLFTIGKAEISPFVVIIAILIISFANRSAVLIKRLMLPNIYERYQFDIGLRYTLDRVVHYSIVVLAVLISLSTVGINLSTLTVFAGVVGVGIGFGMQNIASNFISGLIILFERPIKVGDRVMIKNVVGDVERINMRATIVKTLENEHIIIPNSYFLQEQVVNRSYGDLTLRLTIDIGVSYDADVDEVRDALLTAVSLERTHSPEILQTPQPFVNFQAYGDSSLDFQLFVWISHSTAQIEVSSNLRFRVWHELARRDIEIPFPQRDLHIRSIDDELLTKLRESRQ